MNSINNQILKKIFDAKASGLTNIRLDDTDGKSIVATMNSSGWYEGYY